MLFLEAVDIREGKEGGGGGVVRYTYHSEPDQIVVGLKAPQPDQIPSRVRPDHRDDNSQDEENETIEAIVLGLASGCKFERGHILSLPRLVPFPNGHLTPSNASLIPLPN